MERKEAIERLDTVSLKFSEFWAEDDAIYAKHEGSKTFELFGFMHPEIIRHTGKGCLLIVQASVELIKIAPTAISMKLKGE